MSATSRTNLQISRKELATYLFSRPEKSFQAKSIHLTQYVIKKTGCPANEEIELKRKLSNFLIGFKLRYNKVNQKKDRFKIKYDTWLQKPISFPKYNAHPGRPIVPFIESSDRSKRRKTEMLRESTSTFELCYAASMNLRKSGYSKAADIVKNITTSPEIIKSPNAGERPQVLLSPEEALAFFINGRFTVNQYKNIRKVDPCRFPSYGLLNKIKLSCIPPIDTITITEKCATIRLQALLDNTVERLVLLQNEVVSSIQLDNSETVNLKLIVKWGCDGSSGMSEYKQSFVNSPGESDSSIFFTSLVPLRMMAGHKIIWHNLRPSSTRFCRPIKMEFTRESTSSTQTEIARIKNEINNLVPFKKTIKDVSVNVTYELLFTMVDNKICNAATATSSSQRCYLCNATSKQFNCINAMIRREIVTAHTMFGLSTLHCWIRVFECMLHISYNLPFEKWQAATVENKEMKQNRKRIIQAQFRARLGLIVDQPKQNYGSSNDGNTARKFFQNLEVSSEITGISKNLLTRLYNILITISCGHNIDADIFRTYCLKTAVVYLKHYPWYYMPTSVHKLLMHSSEIISNFSISIGALSEEAQECRNRDIKNYRQSFSRKCSRKANITDVFNRLLLSSDPLLSSTQKLPKSHTKSIPREVLLMLKPPEAPQYTSSIYFNENNLSSSDESE